MVGAVVIGRNEGERLVKCLESTLDACSPVVYVDSGSADESVARALALGAHVVELDGARPFSAARARNAGLDRLREVAPGVDLVQFIDGDCLLVQGWIETAERVLAADPALAVVCGRRREIHPERSIYNRLCDLEWETPIGPAEACGGDAMMRVAALRAVGGFCEDLIAGEEPELCLRMRRAGGRIERLDAEMTLHDAAIDSFAGWWTRVRRGGYAAGDGWWRHGRSPERFMARRVRSALAWGVVLPVMGVLGSPLTGGISLFVVAALLLGQMGRIAWRARGEGRSLSEACSLGWFLVVGKPAEAVGILQCTLNRFLGRGHRLIEYKR